MTECMIELLVKELNYKNTSSNIILIPTTHFFQRCNHTRNIPPITEKDLKKHLSYLWKTINQTIIKNNNNDSFLLQSKKECINLAIERKIEKTSNTDVYKLLLVTIMRKCDFKPNGAKNTLLICE